MTLKIKNELLVSTSRLQEGCSAEDKAAINETLLQLEALGLIKISRFDDESVTLRPTWLPEPDGSPPTDEWRRVTTDAEAKRRLAAVKNRGKGEANF